MPREPKNISLSEFLEIGLQRGATDAFDDLVRFLSEQGRDGVHAEGYKSGKVWGTCAPVWWRHVDWEATNANNSPAPYRESGGGIDDLWPAMSTESHSSSTASSNVVYFELKGTEPPTPRRVERIELPQAATDLVWPVASLSIPPDLTRGKQRGAPRHKRDLVKKALAALQQVGPLPALPKERDAAINAWLREKGLMPKGEISRDTIDKALKEEPPQK